LVIEDRTRRIRRNLRSHQKFDPDRKRWPKNLGVSRRLGFRPKYTTAPDDRMEVPPIYI
jgi:hypothetical protein